MLHNRLQDAIHMQTFTTYSQAIGSNMSLDIQDVTKIHTTILLT